MVADVGRRYSTILFAGLVLFNSIWIYYIYLSITQIGVFDPASLSRVLDGTAERPYVYRALVPWTAKALSYTIPVSVPALMADAPLPIARTYNALQQGGYERESVAVLAIMFLSLIGLAYAQKFLLSSLGVHNVRMQFVIPLLTQIFVLPFTVYFAYYYDLPQALIFTLALGFMATRKWFGYFALLALAGFNKETSIFLIVVFVIYYLPRLPKKDFFSLFMIQAIIYAGIRASLTYVYRNNPGASMYITWQNHVNQYVAYPPALFMTLGFFLLFGIVILRGWKQKHPFLRASSVILVLIFLLFFVAGMPIEFRVFMDALSVITLLIYPASNRTLDEGAV